jgi:hypothetical protein
MEHRRKTTEYYRDGARNIFTACGPHSSPCKHSWSVGPVATTGERSGGRGSRITGAIDLQQGNSPGLGARAHAEGGKWWLHGNGAACETWWKRCDGPEEAGAAVEEVSTRRRGRMNRNSGAVDHEMEQEVMDRAHATLVLCDDRQ